MNNIVKKREIEPLPGLIEKQNGGFAIHLVEKLCVSIPTIENYLGILRKVSHNINYSPKMKSHYFFDQKPKIIGIPSVLYGINGLPLLQDNEQKQNSQKMLSKSFTRSDGQPPFTEKTTECDCFSTKEVLRMNQKLIYSTNLHKHKAILLLSSIVVNLYMFVIQAFTPPPCNFNNHTITAKHG